MYSQANHPVGPPYPPAYQRHYDSERPSTQLGPGPSRAPQTFARYSTAPRGPVHQREAFESRHLDRPDPSLPTQLLIPDLRNTLSADQLYDRYEGVTHATRQDWEFQTGLRVPFRRSPHLDQHPHPDLPALTVPVRQYPMVFNRAEPSMSVFPHSPLPGRGQMASTASPIAIPIRRSWTLDSPSRSSLAPMKPTHANRPITLDPSFDPSDVVLTEDYNSWDEGNQGYRADRIGGPPKAKLGGPGGRTYEELRAGDQRIVSAPASTPPPRSKRYDREVKGKEKEKEGGKWNSQTIAVRLPVSSEMALPTPSPFTLGGGWQDPGSMPLKRREGKIGSSSAALDLSSSSRSTREGESPGSRMGSKAKKEVIVAAPLNDTRIIAPSRQSSSEAGRSGVTDDARSNARHVLSSSFSSPTANYLDASASSFIPSRPISAFSNVRPPPPRSNSGVLRPYAAPFQPTLLDRRVVTSPISAEYTERQESRRSTNRRSVSDIGGDGPKKRLRPSAPAFQPSRSASIPRSSWPESKNPYAALWQSTSTVPAPKSSEDIERDQNPESGAGDGIADSQRSNPIIPFQFGQASFNLGSASPTSTSSKRSASGVLRPAAPSFVPSASGAFTFRAPAPPTNRFWITRTETEEPKEVGDEVAGRVEADDPICEAGASGRMNASPASRLHDLPDYEENILSSGEAMNEETEIEQKQGNAEVERSSEDGNHIALQPDTSPSQSSSSVPLLVEVDEFSIPTLRSIPPRQPSADVFGPNSFPAEEIEVGNTAQYPIPLENLPIPSRGTTPLPEREPHTPTSSAIASLRDAAEEPYQTAEGSPLIPRRHLTTPPTPHKTTVVESKIDLHLSPTPARRAPFRLPMSTHKPSPSQTSPDLGKDGVDLLVPSIARSGVRSAEAKETDFRNWVYPASPSSTRPQMTRRFTFPVPSGEEASLAGIASTSILRSDRPTDEPISMDLGIVPTESSSRTSVEFPMRPEVKRKLTVTNDDVPEEEVDLGTARPTLPVSHSSEIVGNQDGVQTYLERIEGMLQGMKDQLTLESNLGSDEVSTKLDEEMAGMIAEMRNSIIDRLQAIESSQPNAIDYSAMLNDQRQLLTEILDHSRSGQQAGLSTSRIKDLESAISSLLTGHTTLLDFITTNSSSQFQQATQAESIIEALNSVKEDLELRRASEEKKDEVIEALPYQAEKARRDAIKAIEDRDMMKEDVQRSEVVIQKLKTEKEELSNCIRVYEEGGRRDTKRTDELEASQRAIISERDGLAKALTESFRRQTEIESEADSLARELELERSRASLLHSQTQGSVTQFEQIAASNQAFQDKLLDQVQKLTLSSNNSDEARNAELEALRADKRMLQNEVTDLRKKTYDSASKIAESDLRRATASNIASSLEADFRRSLAAAERARLELERKVADLEIGINRLKEEKLNFGTVATERSGAMRIMEIRHQALIQENVFWREFALSYDRREHRKYTQSRPFRHDPSEPTSDPLLSPTPVQQLPTDTTSVVPASREPDVPVTPHKSTFDSGNGKNAALEGTPDLSMSASSSAEGIVRVADTPEGHQGGEGTWWDVRT